MVLFATKTCLVSLFRGPDPTDQFQASDSDRNQHAYIDHDAFGIHSENLSDWSHLQGRGQQEVGYWPPPSLYNHLIFRGLKPANLPSALISEEAEDEQMELLLSALDEMDYPDEYSLLACVYIHRLVSRGLLALAILIDYGNGDIWAKLREGSLISYFRQGSSPAHLQENFKKHLRDFQH